MTIAFTGSRPKTLWGYEPLRNKVAVEQVFEFLNREYSYNPEVYSDYISGGAQGADQICFKAVEMMKQNHKGITNNLVLPFVGQDYTWSKKGLYSQEDFNKMLSLADNTTVVSTRYDKDAYMKRNRELVDRCDILIAVSLLNPLTSKSGTGYTVRYARSNHVPTYWWDGNSKSLYLVKSM